MNILFDFQQPLAKWFAVFSSLVIGFLGVVAGTLLMFAQRQVAEYDTSLPRSLEITSSIGLGGVFVAWVVHMMAVLLLLGYAHTENRTYAALMLSMASFLYLLYVMASGLSALILPCQSVM